MRAGSRRFIAWLLLLLLSCTEAAEILQNAVLIEFDNAAFNDAVTSASAETESSPAAALAGRDPSAMRRPSSSSSSSSSRAGRAAARRRAAAAVPAAERLARRIVDSATASRIRVRKYQPYGAVFEGMSVEVETPADYEMLRELLRENKQVKKIYPVYMVPLPDIVPPTGLKDDSLELPAAAAAAAAAAAHEDSSTGAVRKLQAVQTADAASGLTVGSTIGSTVTAGAGTDAVHISNAGPGLLPPPPGLLGLAVPIGKFLAAAAERVKDLNFQTGIQSGITSPRADKSVVGAPFDYDETATAVDDGSDPSTTPSRSSSGSSSSSSNSKGVGLFSSKNSKDSSGWEDYGDEFSGSSSSSKGANVGSSSNKGATSKTSTRSSNTKSNNGHNMGVSTGRGGSLHDSRPGSNPTINNIRNSNYNRSPGAAASSSRGSSSSSSNAGTGGFTRTRDAVSWVLGNNQARSSKNKGGSSSSSDRPNAAAKRGPQQQQQQQQSRVHPAAPTKPSGSSSKPIPAAAAAGQGRQVNRQPVSPAAVNKKGGSSSSGASDGGSSKGTKDPNKGSAKLKNRPIKANNTAPLVEMPLEALNSSSSSKMITNQTQVISNPPETTTNTSSTAETPPADVPNNSTSSTNGTADSSSNSNSSSSKINRRPRPATPLPSYLRPSGNISGIDSTVRLPLGRNGSVVNFRPNLEWATADLLTGVTELRTNFNLTGRGVKIGIIDTGIDYTHPAFGSCRAINDPPGQCRVVAGRDMVGDEFVSGKDVMKPDNDPRDCHNSSHGTTVAGIAAAGYHPGAAMLGVAPEAQLGIYKVFGCRGTAPTSAIIGAIQQAVLDGMDIINLSLSLGPGFPEEPYRSVMQRVYDLGVIATKSAGNQGLPAGQGLFWVDAYTGAGSITVGSVDTSSGVIGQVTSSDFSTYGPDANLNLLPHLASPGTNVLTTTSSNVNNGYTVMSGTSHATPYMSGGLALLMQLHRELQHDVRLAAIPKSPIATAQDLNHSTIIPALISTATPVNSDSQWASPTAVAKSGAGLVNFAAAYFNPIEVKPDYISLPSNLQSPYTVDIVLRNTLPAGGSEADIARRTFSYVVSHRRAVAARIINEWGAMPMNLKSGVGANVVIQPTIVTLPPGASAAVQVTYTLPEVVRSKAWLYSGYIDLWPVLNNTSLVTNITANAPKEQPPSQATQANNSAVDFIHGEVPTSGGEFPSVQGPQVEVPIENIFGDLMNETPHEVPNVENSTGPASNSGHDMLFQNSAGTSLGAANASSSSNSSSSSSSGSSGSGSSNTNLVASANSTYSSSGDLQQQQGLPVTDVAGSNSSSSNISDNNSNKQQQQKQDDSLQPDTHSNSSTGRSAHQQQQKQRDVQPTEDTSSSSSSSNNSSSSSSNSTAIIQRLETPSSNNSTSSNSSPQPKRRVQKHTRTDRNDSSSSSSIYTPGDSSSSNDADTSSPENDWWIGVIPDIGSRMRRGRNNVITIEPVDATMTRAIGAVPSSVDETLESMAFGITMRRLSSTSSTTDTRAVQEVQAAAASNGSTNSTTHTSGVQAAAASRGSTGSAGSTSSSVAVQALPAVPVVRLANGTVLNITLLKTLASAKVLSTNAADTQTAAATAVPPAAAATATIASAEVTGTADPLVAADPELIAAAAKALSRSSSSSNDTTSSSSSSQLRLGSPATLTEAQIAEQKLIAYAFQRYPPVATAKSGGSSSSSSFVKPQTGKPRPSIPAATSVLKTAPKTGSSSISGGSSSRSRSSSSSSSRSRSSSNNAKPKAAAPPRKPAPANQKLTPEVIARAPLKPAQPRAVRRSTNTNSSSSSSNNVISDSSTATNSALASIASATGQTLDTWQPDHRWSTIWLFQTSDSPVPPPRPLVIPYQGVSTNYSTLPLTPGKDSFVDPLTPGLCYAPAEEAMNINYPEYAMDIAYDVNNCKVNTADYWTTDPIEIPLNHIKQRPCDLRVTLSPQLPVKRIDLQLLDATGKLLGYLGPISTPVFSRVPAYDASSSGSGAAPAVLSVYSYCLNWRGLYRPVDAAGNSTELVQVAVGKTYRLTALLEAPVALGDQAAMQSPLFVQVPIRGAFTVTRKPMATLRKLMRKAQR